MNWGIIGHKRRLEFLENALQKGKLAHAYLFAGPAGVGKQTIARTLARSLLAGKSPSLSLRDISPKGGEKNEESFHPDLLEVGLLEDKSEITIAQIRDLSYKLSLKPYSAEYKVAIIDNAESMNSEAANALLKVLEEPKPNTIIILISSNPNRLPKTIISRTQKITFGELSPQEISQITQPNEEAMEKLAEIEDYYQKVFNSKLAERLTFVTELSDWETQDLRALLIHWLKKLQVELRMKASLAIANRIKAVNDAAKGLSQNANSKLLLANLMISL